MRILVLESDPKELALLNSAINRAKSELVPIGSSEYAWGAIQSGESNFLIANWDTSDLRKTQFIPRIRAAHLPGPLYILLTTSGVTDDDLAPSEADDVLQRPFGLQELKHRIAMGERIVSLAGSLAVARDQLDHQAVFDNLTGFMNRPAFLRQAAGELERARRNSMPVSMVALDLDNFRTINEIHGVETGNECLKVVANAIREKSRPYDCIGRWAGDEFIVMVSGVIGADAEKISERIIAGARGVRIEVGNEAGINIKVSAGVASVSRINASAEVESLIQQARQAMARAKEAGGNQVFLIYA